ncbi:MAG TPA: MBL fold metallo-hydrolase [Blastocatellia bacterium]|nr:MBL fold metallo-hydrolase [Blastocatellia bacterium]
MNKTATVAVTILTILGGSYAVRCARVEATAPARSSSPTTRPAPKAEDDFKIVQVADGVFAAIAKSGGLASGNAGFIVGDSGVLVVDTFFTPAAIEELIAEISARTTQPIKYAVNTHYHLDHTGGNQVLAARNIPIVAHDNVTKWQTTKNRRFLPQPEELQKRRADAARQLAEAPEDQKDKRAQLERQISRFDAMLAIKLTPPSLTFGSGTMHLYLGNREVVLVTLPGHTGGDVLVYVPDANVVFMGDMGWAKTLPNLVDATVNDWIPSLDTILSHHGNAKFVPGHGEVAGASEIREFRDYLDDLRSRVKQAIAEGLTADQAKTQLKLPEKYKAFAFQNFAQPNVEDMYKEMKGTKQSG